MVLSLPPLMDCPRCGMERELTTAGNMAMPSVVVVVFTAGPCELCDVLDGTGA